MKKGSFILLTLCIAALAHAQQKETDTTKFTPPVIVKDTSHPCDEMVKFTPPVIVKNKAPKNKKTKENKEVKFTPPVIKKKSENE